MKETAKDEAAPFRFVLFEFLIENCRQTLFTSINPTEVSAVCENIHFMFSFNLIPNRSKTLDMDGGKGSTTGKGYFQATSSNSIDGSHSNNGSLPTQSNVDKLTCDIAKVELVDASGDTPTTTIKPVATKCRNCSCDINRKTRSEESAAGIVQNCPTSMSTSASVNVNTVNPPVNDAIAIATNNLNESKMPNCQPIERQQPPYPTYLPPHFRNLPKTQSLDLVDERSDSVGGLLSASASTTELPKVIHPFDQNRPIYPNVPYSPYGSPYGSPRSGRRRVPLRESRRISIEQTGSFLQLNQYKLMDQIGQVSVFIR